MANTKIPSELVAINAISGTLIADNAITSVHIAENNITATQIAINAVTALQMADGTITSAKIADGTIVTADIADGQISTAKLVDGSVTQAKIGNGAVVAGSIASGTITSTQMAGNSVSTANVQDNAINLDKMAGITRGSIIYGNAAGNPAYLAAGTNGHVLTSDGTDISWTADTDLFLASSGGTISGSVNIGSYQGSAVNSPLDIKSDSNHFAISIEENSGTETWQLGVNANGDLNFYDSGATTPIVTFSDSNNIGIGETDPDNKLDVNFNITGEGSQEGGIKIHNVRGTNNDIAPLYFGVHGGTRRTKAAIGLKREGSYGIGSLIFALDSNGDDANVTFANDEKMRIQTSGNVGIGTDSPAEKLQVKGALGLQASNSTNRWSAYTYTDNTFRLNYNGAGADEFLIKSDGNVGIRNTNPAATLEVGTLTSGSTGNVIINSEGGNPPALQVKSRTNRARINVQDNDTSGYIIAEGNVFSFGFADAVSDNNININTSHDVGIGTDTPIAKLHIQDNTSTVYDATAYQHDLFIEKRNTAGNNQVGSIRFAVTGHDGSTTAEASIGVLQTSNAHSGNLVFGTRHSGTRAERMRIASDGNVGINYADPKAKLHVRAPQNDTMITANAFAAFDGTGGDGIIIGARNSSPFTAYIQSGYTPNIGTSHHYPLSLNPHGGNVGVGIASPGARFHVHSDSSSDIVKFENNNGSFILGKTANLASIDLASDAGMRIRHGSTQSAYFSADDVVFNNGHAAQNFRVESDTNTHMIYVDGTNNHVMFGNSTHQPVSQHNNQAGIGYNGAIGQTQMATTGNNAALEIGKNQGTDGNLVVFRKQSNIIGNIGTQGDDITIGNDNVGLRFGYAGLSNIVPVDIDNNDLEDNIISLGHANSRFKDLTMGGNVKCGRIENIGSTITTNFHTAQKGFQVAFANGVANQKIKLILAQTWWGDLTVRLTGTYSNQNMAGVLEKRYGTGSNPSGTQYSNESRVTESLGATADNFHIGDIIWDSGLGKYVIVITHRVSTGNTLAINVEGFCQAASDVTDLEDFTVSSVYTTDTTAYGQQEKNPAFAAILTGGQVVTGTNTNIGFANEIFDNTGSHSSGVFTAPVPGIYSFGANFLLYPFTTGIVNVRYIKNSTAQTTVQHGASANSHTGITLTHLLTLAQGDTVSIQVSGSSLTGSTAVYGGQTYWHGHLIG